MSDSEKLQNWGEQETLEQMHLEVLAFEMCLVAIKLFSGHGFGFFHG
jgi:hypothetical protein